MDDFGVDSLNDESVHIERIVIPEFPSFLMLGQVFERNYFFDKSNSPQRRFRAPMKPKTPTKSVFKKMLIEVRMLYADRTVTKIPTAIITKDNILPTVSATLKTSKASVPVVSFRIDSLFGM